MPNFNQIFKYLNTVYHAWWPTSIIILTPINPNRMCSEHINVALMFMILRKLAGHYVYQRIFFIRCLLILSAKAVIDLIWDTTLVFCALSQLLIFDIWRNYFNRLVSGSSNRRWKSVTSPFPMYRRTPLRHSRCGPESQREREYVFFPRIEGDWYSMSTPIWIEPPFPF